MEGTVQLDNSFTIPVPVDDAWKVLLDVERIAPCMPGAVVDSVDGDDFTGRVKVKLGPIALTYQGKASFVEKDETTHKAVIDGRGKDQKGNGTASALITATLTAEGDTTRVDVVTDLNITGRPAQFGRGVMVDVGNKLLGQFADKLAAQLTSGDQPAVEQPAPAAAANTPAASGGAGAAAVAAAASPNRTVPTVTARTAPAGTGPRPVPAVEPEPIDLLGVAGGSVVSKVALPAAGVLVALLIWLAVRRRG
jgi:carbon monoxide dehydrogenase subunit G